MVVTVLVSAGAHLSKQLVLTANHTSTNFDVRNFAIVQFAHLLTNAMFVNIKELIINAMFAT